MNDRNRDEQDRVREANRRISRPDGDSDAADSTAASDVTDANRRVARPDEKNETPDAGDAALLNPPD